MKANRSGWKGESRRHSLARKGIKTVIDDKHRLAVNNYVARGQSNRDAMIEQVKMIYGVGKNGRLLHARLEETSDIEGLVEAMKVVGGYNSFNADRVGEELLKLHNDGVIMGIEFGRESSPVMYIHIPYWTHQSSNAKPDEKGRMYSKEEKEVFVQKIKDMGRSVNVDEIDEAYPNTYRLWWD